MRTIQKQAYQIDELSDEAKENALDRHREINLIDDLWYEAELEGISELIKQETGLELNSDKIYFEILSRENQIAVESADIESALAEKYPTLIEADLPKKFGLFCNYLGGGLSSGLIESDFDTDRFEFENEFDEEDEELQSAVRDKLNEELKERISEDLSKVQDILRKGYHNLYEQYTYLFSDEAVEDTLKANELEFDKFGFDI